MGDHPRGCGDKSPCMTRARGKRGSPPRMRGQVWCGRNFSLLRRITPEDAGTSYPSNLFHNVIKDHPRGCGDKPDAFVLHYHLGGSPPRMRGQESRTVTSRVIQRITPADAGTSLDPRIRLYSPEDHPRGCGDKLAGFEAAAPPPGSPPRMRGQVRLDGVFHLQLRIPPADAGTRHMGINGLPYATDHPRGCGDKNYFSINFYWFIGSPPRMRGQVIPPGLSLSRCWITPADAGTSCHNQATVTFLGDHPRGCGDKFVAAVSWESPTGSPPRMRGQGPESIFGILLHRITPADAGTRLHPLLSPLATWDHPRGCGDK